MRGTIRTAAALAAVAILVAGCASAKKSPSSSSSPTGGASAASFKACMVTDTGGIDDRSFNASSWQGVKQAEGSGVTGTYLQSTSESDYVPNINQFIGQSCGIVVTVGFLMGDATKTAATAHPSQKFAIVDYTYQPALTNVDALLFNTVQDAFLGGYLAAAMSKSSANQAPSGATRMAAPLPIDPCPSKTAPAAMRHSVPRWMAERMSCAPEP